MKAGKAVLPARLGEGRDRPKVKSTVIRINQIIKL